MVGLRRLARGANAGAIVAILIGTIGPFNSPDVVALELTDRSITVSDITAAESDVTYQVAFTTNASAVLGSVLIQFCSNSSLVDDECEAPEGFSTGSTTLADQEGITGFSILPSGEPNWILIGRPAAIQSPEDAVLVFNGLVNPLAGGSYFARLTTYPTSDGSGPYADAGGLALSFRGSIGISTQVPPHLIFCVGGSIQDFDCTTATESFNDLGILSDQRTSSTQSQMLAATNASSGYTTWVLGNTMTSGNNTLPVMLGETSKIGKSQFGINLMANTSPVVGNDPVGPGKAKASDSYSRSNEYYFSSGDALVTTDVPDDYRKYTVSYVVNVSKEQPGGIYVTTITYMTLANF